MRRRPPITRDGVASDVRKATGLVRDGRCLGGLLLAAMLMAGTVVAPGSGRAGPASWVLRPETADTLRQALEDPGVRERLPSGWQVESLAIGARSVQVRLRPPSGGCLLGELWPREPGQSIPAPIAWTGCPEAGEIPGDSPPEAFAEALLDRLGPQDFAAVQPPDAPSDSPHGTPLGLLLASAGIQFLLLVVLSVLALVAPGRASGAGTAPSPDASRSGPLEAPP